MDLAQISYGNSTSIDKHNDTKIGFIAPSKLKLWSVKDGSEYNIGYVQ